VCVWCGTLKACRATHYGALAVFHSDSKMGSEMSETLRGKSSSDSLRKIRHTWPEGATAILLRWLLPTRLETRTKESITCASVRVENSYAK
jgi:hypothetical protein